MRNAVTRAAEGRAALVVGVVALVAALGGSAIALPGQNSVDSGDIKNSNVSVKDLKIAYVYIRPDNSVQTSNNVKDTDYPGAQEQVLCIDLKFKAKTASATRAPNSGGAEPFNPPHVGIRPVAGGLCDAPFNDGVIQVPGSTSSGGTYANFFG